MFKYFILDGQNPKELQDAVNLFISEGYEPVGGVTDLGYFILEPEGKSRRFIVQAVIALPNCYSANSTRCAPCFHI